MAHRSIFARLVLLVVLLIVVLIPYGSIAERQPWFGAIVNGLFASEAAHAVAHTLGFIAVGSFLLRIFPGLLARPWLYFGLILAVALAQEGLQLLMKGRGVVLNDITDIGTDLVAAGLVFALARAATRSSPSRSPVVE